MADTIFNAWSMLATGATTARTLPDRLADVVNVLDYGADSTGVNPSSTAVQLAFDAAFGSSGAPHGTSSHLNRPVYFPNGIYKVNHLTMTQVKGGLIKGAGAKATELVYDGSVPGGSTVSPIITTDGCEDTIFQDLTFRHGTSAGTTNTVGLDLDWSGSGAVELKNNSLINVSFFSSNYCMRVARSGYGGANTNIIACAVFSNWIGFSTESAEASLNSFGSSTGECDTGIWVQDGSFNAYGHEFSGSTMTIDILHDSTQTSTVLGGRSESRNFLNVTAGKVQVTGILHASAGAGFAINGTGSGTIDMTSCVLGEVGTTNTGRVTGAPKLFLRNVSFARDGLDTIFVSFTGTIYEYGTEKIFTQATLPAPPGEGLIVNISDANTSAWGGPVTASGGQRGFVRYNGSGWTLVGI